MTELGNLSDDEKGKAIRESTSKCKIPKHPNRGRFVRSSDEVLVMRMERRDEVDSEEIRVNFGNEGVILRNLETGGAV